MIVYIDFDGTLAYYDTWKGQEDTGSPIPLMVNKLKEHLAKGDKVWIYTARLNPSENYQPHDNIVVQRVIKEWCIKFLGFELPMTGIKGPAEIFYDDRAIRIVKNTGLTMGEFLVTMSQQLKEQNISKEEALEILQTTIKDLEKVK